MTEAITACGFCDQGKIIVKRLRSRKIVKVTETCPYCGGTGRAPAGPTRPAEAGA